MTTNKQTLSPADSAAVVNDVAHDEANMPPPDAGGTNPLSDREMDVARLLATGATNGKIADTLVISPHTVKVHLRNIFDKLQVSSRTEASMLLVKRGWVVVPGVDVGSGESSEIDAPISEPGGETLVLPQSLEHIQATPRPWQLGIVMTALAMSLVALLLPAWLPTPKSTIGLLSDSGQIILGKPGLNNLPYQWEIQPPLSQARSRLAAAEVEGKIYAVGGEAEDGSTLDLVEIYDLLKDSWREGEPMPAPRANLAMTASGDELIVAGGSYESANAPEAMQTAQVTLALYDDMLRYHRTNDRWSTGGKLPMTLAGAALVAHGEFLYLMGGWNGSQMQDQVWRLPLDKVGDAVPADWQEITRLPTAVAWFGAVVLNDLIYVAGGYDGRYELNTFATFDPASGEWRQLTPLTTPRGGMSLVYDGNTVLALGGGWTNSIQNHERYDAWTNQWTLIDSPITGEWRHFGAAASEGSVYILGGWSGAYLDTHLQFQSTFRALLPAIPNVREGN